MILSKKIGKSDSILFDMERESVSNSFAKLLLTINNINVIESTGNLSFFCVDLEGVDSAAKTLHDDHYFWTMTNQKLIGLWNVFYNAKTLEELEKSDVRSFDKEFQKVRLQFTSEFFDEKIMIVYKSDGQWYFKSWEKPNPSKVTKFQVTAEAFEISVLSVVNYLRGEVLH